MGQAELRQPDVIVDKLAFYCGTIPAKLGLIVCLFWFAEIPNVPTSWAVIQGLLYIILETK